MNITVRRARPEDLEDLLRVYESPRVVWGTLQLPYPSVSLWRERLTNPPSDIITLVALVDGELVGNLGLHLNSNRPRRHHVGGIGMGVRDDMQGKGVGAALMQAAVDLADKWLNLERLELEVYTDNAPAIRLYEKFGFVIEGTMRRHAFRDGQYVDSHVMGRLRPQIAGTRAG